MLILARTQASSSSSSSSSLPMGAEQSAEALNAVDEAEREALGQQVGLQEAG